NEGWNNCTTEGNEAARAAPFDGSAHHLNGTGKYLVYSLLRGLVVEADCGNLFNKTLHAVGANDLPGVSYVLFEGRDNRDGVRKTRGGVKCRAKYANDRDAHCLTSRFHTRVKCIALHHSIITVLLGPNDLPNNRRRLQHVVNSGDFVARAEI